MLPISCTYGQAVVPEPETSWRSSRRACSAGAPETSQRSSRRASTAGAADGASCTRVCPDRPPWLVGTQGTDALAQQSLTGEGSDGLDRLPSPGSEHERTNVATGRFRAAGATWTRGNHCSRTVAREEGIGMRGDCYNRQPGRSAAWQSRFYLGSVYSYLRSRRRPPFCIDRRNENQAYTRAFIAIQPWLAEPLFLRPLQELNGWTYHHRHHRQHRARPSEAELRSTHRQRKVGLARPSDSCSGRWAQILRTDLPL